MAIIDIIREKYPTVFSKDGSIKDAFFAPDIPEKKINGAIEKIAPNISPEQIILIVDTTLMGSGKDGFVFTSSAFYYRESFSDAYSTLYSEVEIVEYVKDVKDVKNGKEKCEEYVKIIKKDKSEFIIRKIMYCDYVNLADMLNSIVHNVSDEDSANAESVNIPLESMTDVVKNSYIKIIISFALSDDGIIDAKEFSGIYSLMARLNFTAQQRSELITYSSDIENASSIEGPLANINNEINDSNRSLLYISLAKDLLNIHSIAHDGKLESSPFLISLFKRLGVSNEQVVFIQQALNNDRKIFDTEIDDKALAEGFSTIVSKAGAVGVPLAAVYLTGSVAGLGAAGITSGLSFLGFGGVLGFSSMATGLGVVVLLGLGAHHGIKTLTGGKEVEKAKRKEFMLQGVIKHNQKTINMLMEDINTISAELLGVLKEAAKQGAQIAKIVKKLNLLASSGARITENTNDAERLTLLTKLPKLLDINKLKNLTEEPTRQKYFDIVKGCYPEAAVNSLTTEEQEELSEQSEGAPETAHRISPTLSVAQLQALVNIFTAIGYFSVSGLAKDTGKKLKEMFKK
jgi:hypothetical protein